MTLRIQYHIPSTNFPDSHFCSKNFTKEINHTQQYIDRSAIHRQTQCHDRGITPLGVLVQKENHP